jgi:hypothetical protein
MMTTKVELSIVILTEDSGDDGRPTVEALVRRMLRVAVPGVQSHRIEFVPRDQREEAAMRGNVWKTDGRNPVEHERRVRLLRYMVRKLSQPDTFVLFHIDGDRPWSERHTSENVAKFERLGRTRLPQAADHGRAHRLQGKAAREVTEALRSTSSASSCSARSAASRRGCTRTCRSRSRSAIASTGAPTSTTSGHGSHGGQSSTS